MGNVLTKTVAVLGVGLLGVLGGCGSSLTADDPTDSPTSTTEQATQTSDAPEAGAPAPSGSPGTTEQSGIVIGPETAPVTVTVMTDFRCPACADFHRANAAQLQELTDAGTIKVEYVPVSILDRFSEGTRYSTRAAGAAYCVAETDRDAFVAFDAAMYQNQPPEGTPGHTSEEIAQIAAGVGVGEAGQECIRQDRHADRATQVTEKASDAGLLGTPTVVLNGQTIGNWAPENLRRQIEAMAAQQ